MRVYTFPNVTRSSITKIVQNLCIHFVEDFGEKLKIDSSENVKYGFAEDDVCYQFGLNLTDPEERINLVADTLKREYVIYSDDIDPTDASTHISYAIDESSSDDSVVIDAEILN